MASNLCVCVYTHGYYTLKKEREEEDNETLAQLKAFFLLLLPPLLVLLYSRDPRPRDTTIESSWGRKKEHEGPGLKRTPKFSAHPKGALHHK
jgi:hypothetical protein